MGLSVCICLRARFPRTKERERERETLFRSFVRSQKKRKKLSLARERERVSPPGSFQHFVGCSPRSKQLAHLLHRLESALKEHFQLREMEVPSSEERLRWSLNRFLAAAAKKQFPARIVIVMDAVNRLRGEASAADTLHWLPTELPQGVRIIVSTVHSPPPLKSVSLKKTPLSKEPAARGSDFVFLIRTYRSVARSQNPALSPFFSESLFALFLSLSLACFCVALSLLRGRWSTSPPRTSAPQRRHDGSVVLNPN